MVDAAERKPEINEGEESASTPGPPQRSKGDGVTVEGLFDRYREDSGVPLDSFLKFFRDAVLFNNSWTYGQATTCFFEVATHQPDGEGGTEPILLQDAFHAALIRYARQSSLVPDMAGPRPSADASPEEVADWRWEGFKALVGTNLQAEPRSKDDVLLNRWILSTPIQMVCLEKEYAVRRVYRCMCQAPTWHTLETNPKRKVSKTELSRMLRELIPRDRGGPLRQEDLAGAVRAGNHENTAREQGWRDTSTGDVHFPEFLEMCLRCALGSTAITMLDQHPEDPDYQRGFDAAADNLDYALARLAVVWDVLEEWYYHDLEREQAKEPIEGKLVMEDSPVYDKAYTDVQVVFAHYCTGEPYSTALDYSDPELRLSGTGVFRLCRDAGFMDQRVTFSAVRDAYVRITGRAEWWETSVNYDALKRILVAIARVKYAECRAMVAINLILEKWLVPMAYIDIGESEVSGFVFQERSMKLLLLYEKHVDKMLHRFTTHREIALDTQGVDISARDSAHGPQDSERRQRSKMPQWLTERAPGGATSRTVKVVTLIDVTSFLRALNVLPDLVTVDEVPVMYDMVVNSVPSHQTPINEAAMSVSQVMLLLVHAAFLGFSRPPYAAKYATQTGKVLSMFGRIEIAYHSLLSKFIPLDAPASFPSQSLSLIGITLEANLRDFLFRRRLERGAPLVSLNNSAAHAAPVRNDDGPELERKGLRVFDHGSGRAEGRRPATGSIANLIRDQLFAPAAPHPIGALMETALIHHNSQRFKAATETYLLALNTWAAQVESAAAEARAAAAEAPPEPAEGEAATDQATPVEDWRAGVPPGVLLYFFIALGEVYESAGLEELALACYSEGRLVGDTLQDSPDCALAYSCIGGVLYHMGQPAVALSFFQRARDIRERTLGELHMDTGLLYNNMGACLETLERVTEAIESYQRARDVFAYEHGHAHPRTATAMRNLSRARTHRFDFKVQWAPRAPTACPPSLVADAGKKKKKKGAKKGGKKKK